MKLLELKLVNIKRHKELTINLNGETTIILGPNGCGKSTIVESIFYVLFRVLLVPNINYMISDTIQVEKDDKITYTEKSYIELILLHDDKKFNIKSGLAKTGCSLQEYIPSEDRWEEISNKITDMYSYIKNNILNGMTHEHFINTIYTEQMGILNLVSKNEAPRQQEFDKLIGLDRFQKLHTAVGNASSILNKMKIPNIETFVDDLQLKTDKKNSLVNKKEIDLKERGEQLQKKSLIFSEYTNQKNSLTLKEKDHQDSYDLYMKLNNLATELNSHKNLLNTSDDSLKNLESGFDLNTKETELSEKSITLNDDYVTITKECTEYLNFIQNEKKIIKERIDDLNSDIKLYDQLSFYEKSLEETKKKIEEIDKICGVSEPKMLDVERKISSYKEDIKNVEASIKDCGDKINYYDLSMKQLLKNYNNKNYDFEKVKQYFEKEIDTYDSLNESEYKCSYCQSKITKDQILNQLNFDRDQYQKYSELLHTKEDEKLSLDGKYSTIKEEEFSLLNEFHKLKADVEYNKMSKNDFIKKCETEKVSIVELKRKLKNDLDYTKLTKECYDLTKKLNSFDENDPNFRTIYHYSGVYKTDDQKSHNINDIIVRIQDYVKEYQIHEQLNKEVSNFKDEQSKIMKDIIKYKTLIDDIKIQISDGLRSSNALDLSELYNKVQTLQNEINDLKIKLGTTSNNLQNLDTLISQHDKIINEYEENIKDLDKDIKKLDSDIKNNEIIIKKLEMVSVAKSYFKQDGLAKFIRKYYINKINETMKNYIHLFNFDFIPEIDETAGIVDYHKYSGGQKIAIAILMKMLLNFILKNPINMMILDEPTPYMDEERIEAIKSLVDSMKHKLQIIGITHDTEFMTIDCNKVIFDKGE